MQWKSNSMYTFQNKCYFFIFFCPSFLHMRKNVLSFQNVIAIIFHIYFQFFISQYYNLLIDLVLEIIKYNERKKMI